MQLAQLVPPPPPKHDAAISPGAKDQERRYILSSLSFLVDGSKLQRARRDGAMVPEVGTSKQKLCRN